MEKRLVNFDHNIAQNLTPSVSFSIQSKTCAEPFDRVYPERSRRAQDRLRRSIGNPKSKMILLAGVSIDLSRIVLKENPVQ